MFYLSDYTRQMEAVQRDEIDVGFLLAGWLEANAPQNIPLLQLLGVKQLDFQAERYPFITSTDLVAAWGLSAASYIPWSLRQQVLTALSALNASHKAAQSGGIATFTLASSLELTRKVGENAGVLVHEGSSAFCHSPFQPPHEFIVCPEGFVKDSPEAIEHGCERKGLHCPRGLLCLCRPCIPVLAVNVFPWQVVLGMCVALFAAGLFLTLGWRATLEVADVVRASPSVYRGRRRDSGKV